MRQHALDMLAALDVLDVLHCHLATHSTGGIIAAMPDCRLVAVPRIGYSMNLEMPALYAGYFGAWFGGLPGSP